MDLAKWFASRLRETQEAIKEAKSSGESAEAIAEMELFETVVQSYTQNGPWKRNKSKVPNRQPPQSDGHEWVQRKRAEAVGEIDQLLRREEEAAKKGRAKADAGPDGVNLMKLRRESLDSSFLKLQLRMQQPGISFDPVMANELFEAGAKYQDSMFGLVVWISEKRRSETAENNAKANLEKNRKPIPTEKELEEALRRAREANPNANEKKIKTDAGKLLPIPIGRNAVYELLNHYRDRQEKK